MGTGQKADLEELSQYVAVHPDDYERRWALAKKLYMAWEYNDALKHLLILKKGWTRKLNVLRYLAATYYRLGLYDEAIAELNTIAQLWPNEVAVWEQLARVYEIAGRTTDAAHTWEQIVRISPSHPTAARSVQRLRSASGDAQREDLRLRDGDGGIDLSPYRICKNCGAQNSDEFERCWQCHATLRNEETPIDSVHAAPRPKSTAWLRTLVGGLATVAFLSAGVYVTLIALRRIDQGLPSGYGPVYDVLAKALVVPRLLSAAVLTAAWPLSLWCAFRLSGARPLPWPSLFGTGLLLSSLTYLCMWVPVPWLLYAPLLPAAISLVAILSLGAAKAPQSIAAWILHGAMVLLAGAGSYAGLAGVQPFLQLPAMVYYDSAMSALATPESLPFFASVGSGSCKVQWGSTSSSWLDEQGRSVIIEADPEESGVQVSLALRRGEIEIGRPGPTDNTISVQVVPDVPYALSAVAPQGAVFVVRSRGVLQPIRSEQE
jgi:hypothetical protein